MKAMVLCAGLGTRLRPLTERWPKPALPLMGQPLLRYNLALLKRAECLVGKGVVPAAYSADDYVTDTEGRFSDLAALTTELRDALMTCSDDPLGLAGG